MNLLEVLKEIESKSKLANTKIEDIHVNARAGMKIAIEKASKEFEKLKLDYAAEVLSRSLAFFVYGTPEQCAKFSELASEESSSVTLNADEVYQNITSSLRKSHKDGETFTTNHYYSFVSELRSIFNKLNLPETLLPDYKYVGKALNYDGLLLLVRDLVRSTAKDELNKLYLKNKLTDEALKLRYKDNILPVIVVGATSDEQGSVGSMFKRGLYVVNIEEGQEVNKEFVLENFKNAHKLLRKAKKENVNGQE